jgi:hypothetical protein
MYVVVSEAGNVRVMLKDKQNLPKNVKCIIVLTPNVASFGGQTKCRHLVQEKLKARRSKSTVCHIDPWS